MEKHLIVAGGNGFLGKAILREACKMRIPIVSISRSGEPENINLSEFTGVNWIKAEISETQLWKKHLDNCFGVINCIGTIIEDAPKGLTYEHTIYETATVLGDEAMAAGVKKFVQVSAVKGTPETPPLYMICKLAVERYLSGVIPQLAIVRPGILYGKDKPETITEARYLLDRMSTDESLHKQLWDVRPTEVTIVAKVILQIVLDPELNGVFTLDEIERIDANYINKL